MGCTLLLCRWPSGTVPSEPCIITLNLRSAVCFFLGNVPSERCINTLNPRTPSVPPNRNSWLNLRPCSVVSALSDIGAIKSSSFYLIGRWNSHFCNPLRCFPTVAYVWYLRVVGFFQFSIVACSIYNGDWEIKKLDCPCFWLMCSTAQRATLAVRISQTPSALKLRFACSLLAMTTYSSIWPIRYWSDQKIAFLLWSRIVVSVLTRNWIRSCIVVSVLTRYWSHQV